MPQPWMQAAENRQLWWAVIPASFLMLLGEGGANNDPNLKAFVRFQMFNLMKRILLST